MSCQKRNILIDIFPNWSTDGIIKELTNNHDVPWKNTVDGSVLDLEYYGNHSGNKIISPLVAKLLTATGLSSANKTALANLIYAKYKRAWEMQWSALEAEYEPIENYSMTEHEETNEDRDDNNVSTGSSTTSQNSNTNGSEKIFGFNSAEGVDSTSATNTNVLTGNYSNTGNDHNVRNDDIVRDLTRHGNIGVMSNQQMITQELELREWNFFHNVFDNIDTIMVINVFGEPSETIYYEQKYVTSVNGETGDVTIDIPELPENIVNTVNGETGDVVLDIPVLPDNIVNTVNGQSGDVTLDIPTYGIAGANLGLVKGVAKTEETTQEVAIDVDGSMWVKEGGGGGVNYSTEEQDTGIKWLDGSAIYKITTSFAISRGQSEANIRLPQLEGLFSKIVNSEAFASGVISGIYRYVPSNAGSLKFAWDLRLQADNTVWFSYASSSYTPMPTTVTLTIYYIK